MGAGGQPPSSSHWYQFVLLPFSNWWFSCHETVGLMSRADTRSGGAGEEPPLPQSVLHARRGRSRPAETREPGCRGVRRRLPGFGAVLRKRERKGGSRGCGRRAQCPLGAALSTGWERGGGGVRRAVSLSLGSPRSGRDSVYVTDKDTEPRDPACPLPKLGLFSSSQLYETCVFL